MRTTSPTTRTIRSKRRGAAADRRNSRRSVQAMRRWSGDRTARARFPRRAAIALRIARSRPQRHGVSGAARCRISGIRAARYGRYSGDFVRQRGTRDCAPRGDCFPDRTESRQIGHDSRQPLSNRCHARDGACTMRESLPMRARARRCNVSGSRAPDVASAGCAAGSRPIVREAARPSRGAGPTAAAQPSACGKRAGSDAAVTRRSSGTDLNNDIRPWLFARPT